MDTQKSAFQRQPPVITLDHSGRYGKEWDDQTVLFGPPIQAFEDDTRGRFQELNLASFDQIARRAGVPFLQGIPDEEKRKELSKIAKMNSEQRIRASRDLIATLDPTCRELLQGPEWTRINQENDWIAIKERIIKTIIGPKAARLCAEYEKELENSFGQLYDHEDSNVMLTHYSRVKYFEQEDYKFRALPLPNRMDSDVRIIRKLLSSLPDSFKEVKVTINRSLGRETFVETVALILNWVADAMLQKPVPKVVESAMALQQHRGGRHNDTNCRTCGETGHLRPKCPHNGKASCDICEQLGSDPKVVKSHLTRAHFGKTPPGFVLQHKAGQRVNAAEHEENEDDHYAWHLEHDEPHSAWYRCQLELGNGRAKFAWNCFDVMRMPKDSNCFYWSVITALKLDLDPRELRDIVAEEILRSREYQFGTLGVTFKDYIENYEGAGEFEAYLAGVRKHVYGGPVEAVALEALFGVTILLCEERGEYFVVSSGDALNHGVGQPPIALRLTRGATESGNHYDLLQWSKPTTPQPLNIESSDLASAPVQMGTTAVVCAATNRATRKRRTKKQLKAAARRAAHSRDSAPEETLHISAAAGPIGPQSDGPSTRNTSQLYYLDSGATAHLLQPGVVKICDEAVTVVSGISGHIRARTGVHPVFGRALVHAITHGRNLVSHSRLENDGHRVAYDGKAYIVTLRGSGKTLVFERTGNLFLLKNSQTVLSATSSVSDRAKLLHESLHHPSDEVLARCLAQGTFKHSITAADVRKAREEQGPCVACLKGKATAPPAPASTRPRPSPGTSLVIDILFIDIGLARKSPFLLAIDEGSLMAAGCPLANKTAKVVHAELSTLIARFNILSGTRVKNVTADPETSFEAIANLLAAEGIALRIMPAERHARLAERFIRDIKDHMRSSLSALPFALPRHLYLQLFLDCIMARNLVSHRRLARSPRELLSGSKIDVETDFLHPFGTVGETLVTGWVEGMSPKTELAVVVGHFLDQGGAINVWIPGRNQIAKRHSIAPTSFSSDTLAQLNFGDAPFSLDDVIATAQPPSGDPAVGVTGVPIAHASINITPTTTPMPSTTAANDDTTAVNHDTAAQQVDPPPTPAIVPAAIPAASALPDQSGVGARPKRTVKAPSRLIETVQQAVDHNSRHSTPEGNFTYGQAMKRDPERTTKAMEAEVSQFLRLAAIGRKDAVLTVPPLPSKVFLKWKSEDEVKARVVIGGHKQDPSTLGDTYSPTVNTESVNLELGIATITKKKPYVVDVSGAFLHVPLRGQILHVRLVEL
jgi:hypothetical protein